MSTYEQIIKWLGNNWLTALILVIATGLIALPKVWDGAVLLWSWLTTLFKKIKIMTVKIKKGVDKIERPEGPPIIKTIKIKVVVTTWKKIVFNLKNPCLFYSGGIGGPSKNEEGLKVKKDALNLFIKWRDVRRIIFSREIEDQTFKINIHFRDGSKDDFMMADQWYGVEGVLTGESEYGPTNILLKDIEILEITSN